MSRWYFLLCVQEMSCFSVCCTCFILPQDQFVSTTIIICLFPVHLCKQHCLKHPTLVFPRLVVLSKITILILQRVKWPFWGGRGSYRAKVQSHTGISSGVFFLGGGGSEEGGCSELFQKLLRAGLGYFLEQHNTVKLCKRLCGDQSYYLDLLYVFWNL